MAALHYDLNADRSSYTLVSAYDITEKDNVIIPSTYDGKPVTAIGEAAFQYAARLTNITIGQNVQIIGVSAFWSCGLLKTITIPEKVTFISPSAFQYCTGLTSIEILSKTAIIGSSAFRGCSSLTSVTIDGGITSIEASAFQDCNKLKTIVLFPETPPTLGSDAIPATTTIYVPQSSKEAYKTATNWNAFASKIESNNTYLSLARFNKKNKEYIQEQIDNIYQGNFANAKLITYSDLITLRDNANLSVGTWYRIIDYVTTTTQAESRSAGHQFDILVLATSTSELSKDAKAVQHEGDTYFQYAKLESWELKYCLDNDTTRFAWADTENGKGVIYYMKDEHYNECPYDFKNIQFKRYLVSDIQLANNSTATALLDAYTDTFLNSWQGEWFANAVSSHLKVTIDETQFIWFYTFTAEGATTSGSEDDTVRDDSSRDIISNTLIRERCDGNYGHGSLQLNNIVFTSLYMDGGDESNDNDSSNNTFGFNCKDMTFNGYCYNNSFGNSCYSNSFGNGCYSNLFGNECYYNSFGNSCYNNSFGNDCSSNSFGNDCDYNSFGNGCYSNSFGNSCYYNSFGNSCYSNSFGNSCCYNSFGNSCYYNLFGNSCDSNSFGNDCDYNSFGNGCYSNILDGSNKYMSLTYSGASSSNKVQYHHFTVGFSGASDVNKIECFQSVNAVSEYIFYKPDASVWSCRYYSGTTDISINLKYKTSVADTEWTVGNVK